MPEQTRPCKVPATVWATYQRGEFFGEADPPGPERFVGVYATREEALKHCWPEGDSRWVREIEVGS